MIKATHVRLKSYVRCLLYFEVVPTFFIKESFIFDKTTKHCTERRSDSISILKQYFEHALILNIDEF